MNARSAESFADRLPVRLAILIATCIVLPASLLAAVYGGAAERAPAPSRQPVPPREPVPTDRLPPDIEGGAFAADLTRAAEFAWAQMIAMQWAAVVEDERVPRRGVAAPADQRAKLNRSAPRVWQTLRAKTELFPGIGAPHGADQGPATDFGYDQPPLFRYDPAAVGAYPKLPPGEVPACAEVQADRTPPWVELSETHEVGPEKMFAGSAPDQHDDNPHDDQRIFYSVKVDRAFYRYTVQHGWLDGGNAGSTIPARQTAEHVAQHGATPPDSDSLVGFPDGSMQIKAAWRRLSDEERRSGRFVTAIARSYEPQDPSRTYAGAPGRADHPCYVDAEWGLVGMHFQTRTPSAPYYVWSTFEHSDNLVSVEGDVVEDAAGRTLRNRDLPPTDPPVTASNAVAADPPTPATVQRMSPARADATPGKRLYFENLSGTPTTQGVVAVNRRAHPLPDPVIAANEAAHTALRRFFAGKEGSREVLNRALLYYKLVGVQWRPASKPVPGEDLKPDPAAADETLRFPGIYYLANMMLETSHRLQYYSGVVQSPLPPPNRDLDVQDLITDFDAAGTPVANVLYREPGASGAPRAYNMGGCMGCHGQMQLKGYEFSFILRRGRIDAPEMDAAIRIPLAEMVHPRADN